MLSPLDNYFLPHHSRLYVSLSRYLDVCIFGESTNFKIIDVITGLTAHSTLHFQLFLKNLREYKNEIQPDISGN